MVYAHEDSIQGGGEKNLKIDNDTNEDGNICTATCAYLHAKVIKMENFITGLYVCL